MEIQETQNNQNNMEEEKKENIIERFKLNSLISKPPIKLQ